MFRLSKDPTEDVQVLALQPMGINHGWSKVRRSMLNQNLNRNISRQSLEPYDPEANSPTIDRRVNSKFSSNTYGFINKDVFVVRNKLNNKDKISPRAVGYNNYTSNLKSKVQKVIIEKRKDVTARISSDSTMSHLSHLSSKSKRNSHSGTFMHRLASIGTAQMTEARRRSTTYGKSLLLGNRSNSRNMRTNSTIQSSIFDVRKEVDRDNDMDVIDLGKSNIIDIDLSGDDESEDKDIFLPSGYTWNITKNIKQSASSDTLINMIDKNGINLVRDIISRTGTIKSSRKDQRICQKSQSVSASSISHVSDGWRVNNETESILKRKSQNTGCKLKSCMKITPSSDKPTCSYANTSDAFFNETFQENEYALETKKALAKLKEDQKQNNIINLMIHVWQLVVKFAYYVKIYVTSK